MINTTAKFINNNLRLSHLIWSSTRTKQSESCLYWRTMSLIQYTDCTRTSISVCGGKKIKQDYKMQEVYTVHTSSTVAFILDALSFFSSFFLFALNSSEMKANGMRERERLPSLLTGPKRWHLKKTAIWPFV
jgi:hypothetical protein